MYQITIKIQQVALQDLPKFTQIGNFGLKHWQHLATLLQNVQFSFADSAAKQTFRCKKTRLQSRVTGLSEIFFGQFFLITLVAQYVWLLFSRQKLCINFCKNWVGLHFERFFHKIIWSHWWRGTRAFFSISFFDICSKKRLKFVHEHSYTCEHTLFTFFT
jgi:hypothetical protein